VSGGAPDTVTSKVIIFVSFPQMGIQLRVLLGGSGVYRFRSVARFSSKTTVGPVEAVNIMIYYIIVKGFFFLDYHKDVRY